MIFTDVNILLFTQHFYFLSCSFFRLFSHFLPFNNFTSNCYRSVFHLPAGGVPYFPRVLNLRVCVWRYTILEKSQQLGGTWWDNFYPGVACDVPSHLYSYSFFQVPLLPGAAASWLVQLPTQGSELVFSPTAWLDRRAYEVTCCTPQC